MAIATAAQAAGAYGTGPSSIPAQGSYYLPEKIMLTIDQVRARGPYNQNQHYSYSTSEGTYVPVYTEATQTLEWIQDFPLMSISSNRFDTGIEIATEEGWIEDLLETILLIWIGFYTTPAVSLAISTFLHLAEGEPITFKDVLDEVTGIIADKLGLVNFELVQWIFSPVYTLSQSEISIGDYSVTITESPTEYQSPTSQQFKVYMTGSGAIYNMINETRTWN